MSGFKCTRCRGVGKMFKPHGVTEADLIPCTKCNGTGKQDAPPKYKPTKNHYKHTKRHEGMDRLKDIEAV